MVFDGDNAIFLVEIIDSILTNIKIRILKVRRLSLSFIFIKLIN